MTRGLRKLVGVLKGDSPQRLLPLFGLLCVVAALVIIGVSYVGIGEIYRSAMVQNAEDAAVSVGQVMFAGERENLVVRDSSGNEALHVPSDKIRDLDAVVRRYLEPFHMRKIKIFSADKRVVYSSDHGLIGRRDSGNETLDRVLRERQVDSTAKQSNQFTELGGTVVENRQIVEAYLPIISGERILGAFEVYVDITSEHEMIERAILSATFIVAVVVVLSILVLYLAMRRATMALLAANGRIESFVSADPLARLLNHDALMRHAEREIAKLHSAAAPPTTGIGLVMLDIDHFKRINDEYGRAGGDLVLQAVAKSLVATTRKRDLVGRRGGEAFLLLLPATTRAEAVALAERLRAAIAATPVELPSGSRINATASFGVAQLDLPEKDFEGAVRRADEAMRQAKQSGRNRVRISD